MLKTKGSLTSQDAARKLIYLAIHNAVPQWTRTRGWTKAMLVFKIQFGDRVPDEPSTRPTQFSGRSPVAYFSTSENGLLFNRPWHRISKAGAGLVLRSMMRLWAP